MRILAPHFANEMSNSAGSPSPPIFKNYKLFIINSPPHQYYYLNIISINIVNIGVEVKKHMPDDVQPKKTEKTGKGTQAEMPTPSKQKPILRLLPFFIIIGILAVVALSQTGYIKLPHINLFGQSDVYKIKPDATVGVHSSYEFSELISLLGPESSASPAIYTYYLGSGVGFPPMGLILGIDGVLKGTPTVAGTSKFQVCVKDVGGRSTCRTYSLTVNPAVKKSSTCPTTSNPPCRSVQNGVGVSAVIVPASCNCPSDTNFAQMDNITAGGPYKICTCK